MFHHILVPLDGSARAEQALPVAARIARSTGGSLHLARVVSPPIDYSGGFSPVPLITASVVEADLAVANAYLHSLIASPKLSGIEVRTEVLFGLPVQHLLALAEAPEIDLMVLCSHGRTGLTRWVLGSVAHALIHQCSLPILLLRQRGASPSPAPIGDGGPLRTLVPLDGSPLAESVLRPAAHLTAALAAAGQGALHLSQVVKIFPTTAEEGFTSELNEEALERARTYLSHIEERVRSDAPEPGLSLSHSVELSSDVATTLVDLAEQGRAEAPGGEIGGIGKSDLIAISTHGRGGFQRWVIGSITERLLNATKLPMLIVRPSKES